MKQIIFISLFFIHSTELIAQKDKIQIEAAVVGFFNGLSLINADSLQHYSTSDFHLLEDGEVWNMDTLLSKVMPRKNSNIQRVNKFTFHRTVQTGNIAWVSYHNTAEFRLGEKQQKVQWMESAVLVKNKGRWRIQMLHSTKLK